MTAIAQITEKMIEYSKGNILVSHASPLLEDAEGEIDVRPGYGHIGSKALRDAILMKKPKIVVCGHLLANGHAVAKIGDTPVVNASRVFAEVYDAAVFAPRLRDVQSRRHPRRDSGEASAGIAECSP